MFLSNNNGRCAEGEDTYEIDTDGSIRGNCTGYFKLLLSMLLLFLLLLLLFLLLMLLFSVGFFVVVVVNVPFQ